MSFLKILSGMGIIAALVYLAPVPLIDLLVLFLWIVVVPIIFLGAVGVISDGLYETIYELPSSLRKLKTRVDHYRESPAAA